jgi:cysteine desulfurase/selenocysteine lyase
MLGPSGVGVLYGKQTLLESMDPFLGGGEMIKTVTMEKSTWNEIPWKFEAGTPNIAQAIGLGTAVDYLSTLGMEAVKEYEQMLTQYALDKFQNIPGMTVYGNAPERGSVISFNVDGIHPHDMAQILDQSGIAVRAGHHCAQPIMKKLEVSATTRASFYIYNTTEEIDHLINCILKAKEFMTNE